MIVLIGFFTFLPRPREKTDFALAPPGGTRKEEWKLTPTTFRPGRRRQIRRMQTHTKTFPLWPEARGRRRPPTGRRSVSIRVSKHCLFNWFSCFFFGVLPRPGAETKTGRVSPHPEATTEEQHNSQGRRPFEVFASNMEFQCNKLVIMV